MKITNPLSHWWSPTNRFHVVYSGRVPMLPNITSKADRQSKAVSALTWMRCFDVAELPATYLL